MSRPMITIITVLGLAIVFGLIAGFDTFRVLGRSAQDTYHSLESNQFKMKRVEVLIGDLERVALDNRRTSAEYTVRMNRIREQLETDTKDLSYLNTEVVAAKQLLDTGASEYTFEGKVFTRDEVIGEANRKATRALALRERIGHNHHLIGVLTDAVSSLNRHHGEVQGQISTMRGELEALQILAEATSIEQATAPHIAGMDESTLTRAHRLMDEVRADLEVTRQLVQEARPSSGSINFSGERRAQDASPLDRYLDIVRTAQE